MNRFYLTSCLGAPAGDVITASWGQNGHRIDAILELGTASFDGSFFKPAGSAARSNMALLSNEWNENETGCFWALKVRDWILPEEQENLIYSESGIGQEILSSSITSKTSSSDMVYLLDLPSDIAKLGSSAIISYVRDTFWKRGLYTVVMPEKIKDYDCRGDSNRIFDP